MLRTWNPILIITVSTVDTFVFNKYKTFGKYGQQVIKITPELKSLLTQYVKEYKIKSGDLLLGNQY